MYEPYGIKLITISAGHYRAQIEEINARLFDCQPTGITFMSPLEPEVISYIADNLSSRITGLYVGLIATAEIYEMCKSFTDIQFLNFAAHNLLPDISVFGSLKHYIGPWPKFIGTAFRNLSDLSVEFTGRNHRMADQLPSMPTLKRLHLKKAPFESLASLDTRDLEEVDLYNCKTLRDVSALLLQPKLHTLCVEKCSDVRIPDGLKVPRLIIS